MTGGSDFRQCCVQGSECRFVDLGFEPQVNTGMTRTTGLGHYLLLTGVQLPCVSAVETNRPETRPGNGHEETRSQTSVHGNSKGKESPPTIPSLSNSLNKFQCV